MCETEEKKCIEGSNWNFVGDIVVVVWIYLPKMILRLDPILCPACEAPLFWPAWRPMIVLPAASCSSVKSRLDSSAGFGPSWGPVKSGCFQQARPRANKQVVTAEIS